MFISISDRNRWETRWGWHAQSWVLLSNEGSWLPFMETLGWGRVAAGNACDRAWLGACATIVQIFFKVFGKNSHLLKTMSKFTLFYILQTKIFLEIKKNKFLTFLINFFSKISSPIYPHPLTEHLHIKKFLLAPLAAMETRF